MRKFNLGHIRATPGAFGVFERARRLPDEFLARHQSGDWGDVCVEDQLANDHSLIDGSRLLSEYTMAGERIWIITDAVGDFGERESTTILTPEEY